MRIPLLSILLATALTACSTSETGPQPGDTVALSGTVTDEDASSLRKAAAPIEGAVVVASRVGASGSLQRLSGEATTDASGSFSLTTDATVDPVVVTATRGAFAARALLEAGAAARTSARTAPLTAETDSEVEVFLASRARGSAATAADVILFTSADVAADLRAQATTAAEVAAALDASLEAEAEASAASSEGAERARTRRREAVAAFRAALASASGAEARASAFARFESDYAGAYAEAGLALDAQARASQARTQALMKLDFGVSQRARHALLRRSRVAAAHATALAVEAAFEAKDVPQSRLDALAAARLALVAELEAATTSVAQSNAEAEYASVARAQLALEINLNDLELSAAAQASSSARSAFNTAVSSASSGTTVGSAMSTLFSTVEASVRSALGLEADLAAEVYALLSLY